VGDQAAAVGQIDPGDALQRDGEAGARTQKKLAHPLRVLSQAVLGGHGDVDGPVPLVDAGDALAGEGGLEDVEHVAHRKAVDGQPVEIEVDPHHRCARRPFQPGRAAPRQ